MNNKIAKSTLNGILPYVEVLNSINTDLIKIISLDCINNMNLLKELYLDISSKVSVIIQTKIPKNSTKYEDLQRVELCQGINKWFSDFAFLEENMITIFEHNKELLYSLKKVRNKMEHDLDIIKIDEMHSGSGVCGVIFKIKNSKISIQSADLKKLITDLNNMFSKILKSVDRFASCNDEINYYDPYYANLRKHDFQAYNRIINSNLIYDVSLLLNNERYL